jgi:hypothetical protein
VIPGIFGQCVEEIARPFEDAVQHLKAAHRIDVEYVSVTALGSAKHNAGQIANYLTDSQMIHEDALVPGAQYLGFARGDHWAVALPFEDAAKTHPELAGAITRFINRNHYPRSALVEAALRFVVSDLAARGERNR